MNINAAFGNYLKAADLGLLRPVVTMSHVTMEKFAEGTKDEEVKPCLHFVGKDKGLILNKTNANTIITLTGTAETDQWNGQPIRLYVDPNVRFGNTITPAIRIMAVNGTAPPSLPVQAVHVPPAEYGIVDDDVPF